MNAGYVIHEQARKTALYLVVRQVRHLSTI